MPPAGDVDQRQPGLRPIGLVLGLTYMLAALVRLEVVNFRSAVTWYIAV
jgi:hypothetical protein